MYTSKIRSGEAEIIESNTILAFSPMKFLGNTDSGYGEIPIRPIEIDLFYSNEFLFRLSFKFRDDDQNKNPAWRSTPYKEIKTQEFDIINIGNTKEPISSHKAFEVAESGDGSKFYVSFSATQNGLNVQLVYTIYRVESGNL